jgi:hypothetical protein
MRTGRSGPPARLTVPMLCASARAWPCSQLVRGRRVLAGTAAALEAVACRGTRAACPLLDVTVPGSLAAGNGRLGAVASRSLRASASTSAFGLARRVPAPPGSRPPPGLASRAWGGSSFPERHPGLSARVGLPGRNGFWLTPSPMVARGWPAGSAVTASSSASGPPSLPARWSWPPCGGLPLPPALPSALSLRCKCGCCPASGARQGSRAGTAPWVHGSSSLSTRWIVITSPSTRYMTL